MTLELSDLHLERPHRRDRRYRAASARQFVLGNSELVALTRLDHEFASVPFPDGARNRKPEMTVLQPVKDHLLKTGESLAELRTAQSSAFMSFMVEENARGGTAAPSP